MCCGERNCKSLTFSPYTSPVDIMELPIKQQGNWYVIIFLTSGVSSPRSKVDRIAKVRDHTYVWSA